MFGAHFFHRFQKIRQQMLYFIMARTRKNQHNFIVLRNLVTLTEIFTFRRFLHGAFNNRMADENRFQVIRRKIFRLVRKKR